MQNNLNGAGMVIAAIVGFVAVFMALGRVDTYMKIKAMDDCAKSSRYEAQVQDGGKVSYPLSDMYESCLKDKGYQPAAK